MTAPRRARLAVTALAMALLAAPATAVACGSCSDSIIYHAFPWLPSVYLIILGWYVSRTIIRHFWGESSPLNLAAGGIARMVAIGFVGFFFAGLFGVMTFGGFLSLYIIYHLLRDFLIEEGQAAWTLLVVAMVSVTAILLVGYDGTAQRKALSDLEAFDRYGAAGTVIGWSAPQAIARDATVTNADLRPMLDSGEEHRQAKALLILKERRDHNDLRELGESILPILPAERQERDPQWGSPVRVLYDWLDDLLLKDIRTREQLQEWLEPTEKEG